MKLLLTRGNWVSVCAMATLLAPLPASAWQQTFLQSSVEYLASPELRGRLTGSAGEQLAAGYIIARLKDAGAVPVPGSEGFLQPFEFTAGLNDGGTTLSFTHAGRENRYDSRDDIFVLSFSENDTVTAPVVFAGYGITTDPDADFQYDSYGDLDVRDKIVLIFRYFPENVEEDQRLVLSHRVSDLRAKAQNARDRGAKGLLVTAGPAYPPGSDIVPLTFDSTLAGSGVPAASIGGNVATALFQAAGKTLAEVETIQKNLDNGGNAAVGFDLDGVTATLNARIERERRIAHNVIGYFPPNAVAAVDDEWIGIGAHYDHLGDGAAVSNSLANSDERGHVHHGADDNASGVAATLAAAELLAQANRKRPVFFGFWTGEEIGLLGSTAFVRSGPIPTDRIVAYVNLDMVGRLRDDKLAVMGVGSSTEWDRFAEAANSAVGLELAKTADPYTSSDSLAFYVAGVPAVHLFTGSHEDYHRPGDTADKINYPGLALISRFTAGLALQAANAPERVSFVQVERAARPESGSRGRTRVSTGTIPDFTAEVSGLRLSGVVNGSPAAHAGLQEGDIIVEFAGKSIANIHEYTDGLESVRPGQEVKVAFTRDGQRHEAIIVPTSRNR